MFSLQEIKSRINSIKTIKKITKAMQIVAAAKLIKSKKYFGDIKNYYLEVCEIFDDLISLVDDPSKFFSNNNINKDLYILITSDFGLVGSYNWLVINLAKENLKTNDEIIIIGLKGILAFKNNKNKITNFGHIGDEPNYLLASKISKIIVSKFLASEIRFVKIIYTEFLNPIVFKPKMTQILPINFRKKIQKNNCDVEFEPNPEKIIINSLPLYVSAILYGYMTESKIAEMASRRIVMENASDNAEELIEKLRLKYNRARQSKITQEISEIVNGLES